MLRWLLFLFLVVMAGGCSLGTGRSGIEIVSYPTAKVFLNGKEAGMTPYKNTEMKAGELALALEAGEKRWERKIELRRNINTVVDWEMDQTTEESGWYVLYMERTGDIKRAGMMISTMPDEAMVTIEGEVKGFAPMRLEQIGEGDRQIMLSYPGYKTQTIFARALAGYQLVVEASLLAEGKGEEAKNEPTPTTTEEIKQQKIMIKPTETGWLRVRTTPKSDGEEITKVKPGEEYGWLTEENGWYKIDLGNGKSGWILSKYGEKL